MIKLFYSNDTAYLARILARNLEEERAAAGPAGIFTASRVMVPNRNVESFLKLEIAKAAGITANVKFPFLNELFSRLLPQGSVLLDRDLLQCLAAQYLLEHLGRPDELPREIADYLRAGEGSSDATDRRVFQLSDRIARSFHEYTLARPEMLDRWTAGKASGRARDEGARATESWQRQVWVALFGKAGVLERWTAATGRRYLRFDQLRSGEGTMLPMQGRRFHLFGFSYISRTHNEVLARIAAENELFVYAVNPCLEFWEDALTPAEVMHRKERLLDRNDPHRMRERDAVAAAAPDDEDPYHLLENADENEFLQRWGRPGRENIRHLNTWSDCDFYSGFTDPLDRGAEDYSLLRDVQHAILHRKNEEARPRPEGYDPAQDQSIRILQCPEVRREVEIVANEIWDLVRNDRGAGAERLRFTDIAVIIANAQEYDTYATHITSVFQDIHGIPAAVADLSPDSSRIVEAVRLLLAFPAAQVTRTELINLLTHPAVLNRFPGSDAEEWTAWCDGLAIFHGADRNDHADTYIQKDLYSWDQGVRRLALGVFLEGERSGMREPFSADGTEQYLPLDIPQGSIGNAGRFMLLVRSLLADRAFARSRTYPLSVWADFLRAMIETYVAAESPEDERVLGRAVRAIDSLRRRDEGKQPVSYALACEFALAAIGTLELSKGRYLANGVAVSSFLPMRPIPFRVVFIVGMGEGLFPAREMRDPLDLRNAWRQPGDVTPRERDQYNFLETIISTRDRLYLSYVSRDSQTGEPLEPSSIIKELIDVLKKRYCSGVDGGLPFLVRHPLRRYDDAYFGSPAALPSYSPAGRREALSLRLKQELNSRLEAAGHAPEQRLRRALGPRSFAPLLYPIPLPAAATSQRQEVLKVPIYILRKFLECPIQGWAGLVLGLKEEEFEDPAGRVDEAFTMDRMTAVLAQRASFVRSRGADEPAADCRQRYGKELALCELEGTAPTGMMLEVDRTLHQAGLERWEENYNLLALPERQAWQMVRFGRASEHEEVDVLFPPLSLTIERPAGSEGEGPLTIELYGSLEACSPDLASCFTAVNKSGTVSPGNFLRAFLTYVILLAAERIPGGALDASIITMNSDCDNDKQKECARTVRFQDVTPVAARSYLQALLAEMIWESHAYYLTIDEIIESTWFSRGSSLPEIIEYQRASSWGIGRGTQNGPVARVKEYEAPREDMLKRILERRYRLFIERFPKQW